MHQPILWMLMAGLVAQGCNSSSDSDGATGSPSYTEAPTAASGTMTQDDAVTFKDGSGKAIVDGTLKDLNGSQALQTGNGALQPGAPSIGLKMTGDESNEGETGDRECKATVTAGDDTDADSDQVTDSVTRSIDCTLDSDTYSWAAQGTVVWLDKDLEKNPGGLTLTYGPYHSEFTTKTGAHETTYFSDSQGTFDVVRDGKTIKSETKHGNLVKLVVEGTTVEYNYGSFYTQEFESDADATTVSEFFASGTLKTMNGFFRWKMTGADATGGDSAATDAGWDLLMEGKDLVRKSTCTASAYDSGTFTFTDGAGNVTKLTYENCVGTWTYNDVAI